jgi:ParB family chromosome partitioning protein
MSNHLQVPLKNLRHGHEAPNHPGNARVAGRDEGIAELAAHIHARGKIDDLLVYDDGVPEIYFVANGNRSLKALRMIHGDGSDYLVDCKLTTAEQAYEDSLAVSVLAKRFHPVDEYEAFAKLRDERGKSEEEIAQQYGMSEKGVRQVLALGRLSPKIRQAWRDGIIKEEVAKAFTLAIDHATQDRVFDKVQSSGNLYETFVKRELGAGSIDGEVTALIGLIGADAYRGRGGVVTEDLFGTSHIISDVPLLKQMAVELMETKCVELRDAGWAWAEIDGNLPQGSRFWPRSELKDNELVFEGDEADRLEKAIAAKKEIEDGDASFDWQEEERVDREIDAIETAVRARSFNEKKRAKLGCIVDIEGGRLVVLYGVKKPAEAKLSAPADADEPEVSTPKKPAAKPEEPEISGALLHRLSVQLTTAAATALIQDEQLALAVLLAGFCCYSDCGVKVSVSGLGVRGNDRNLLGATDMQKALALATELKPAERISLLVQVAANALDFQNCSLDGDGYKGPTAICNAIEPKALNAALRGAFDAKDYFNGVSKALCLTAINEACGPDLARQQSKNPKGDIADFAIANVPKTGWLPPQLRAKGYDGPPNAKGKVVALPPAKGKAKPPAKKDAPAKRAAAAKKTSKKTSVKKKKR